MTKTKMSKQAAKHFLHSHDTNHDTGELFCYFCEHGTYGEPSDGWGIWIDKNGRVDVDSTSANSEQPGSKLLAVLKIAAKKHLS